MRILFAEDEKDLNDVVSEKLRREGFSVDSCYDGKEAVEFLDIASYDAAVLDVMMPGVDGYAVLKYIKDKKLGIPVMFLTAKDAVSERVKGLNSGADDYLIKPFSLEELTARIRVMIRASHGVRESVLRIGSLSLDSASRQVLRSGREIKLSAKEFQLLEYLMHNAGVVLSRERIEDHIWNLDYEGGTNVVEVYISYLRKKIDTAGEKKLIHTAGRTAV